jgi:hypothetical protein
VFDIQSPIVKLNKQLNFIHNNQTNTLKLRGIIYYGTFHFTAHIISTDGTIWYHDGMTTGNTTEKEGKLNNMEHKSLINCKGKDITLAIYAHI